MPRLEVQNLSFGYRGKKVLDDLSFSISRGETVGILGVNGAGKSTLFRLLSGIYYLQQGVVYFDGMRAARAGFCVSSPMRAKMGVVFQECSIDNKLSARTNLNLSGLVYGLNRSELKEQIEEGLGRFGLLAVADAAAKTFSGGMKRKLELLRAMLHEPEFLLMDEPSAGLDHEGFQRFWSFILGERERRGLTSFIATHRIDEAEKCDRLLVLHQGKLIASESPSELKGRVHGDRICLQFRRDADLELKTSWVRTLQSNFPYCEFALAQEELTIAAAEGHKLVPRLVEVLPLAAVESVNVRRPTLADAFLMLTGASL